MSVETKSLEMYRRFNNEENPLSTGIEGMMQFAGLELFVDEAKKMIEESNPFFSQAYLLFIYYKRQILNFNLEAQNNLAAKKLLEAFGPAGIWVDQKTGETDPTKNHKIQEVHEGLTRDVETTSDELPRSVLNLTSLIATMQRKIVDLLIKSQEDDLLELEIKEEEEEKLSKHLEKQARSKRTTIKDSVEVSVKSQKERRKDTEQKGMDIQKGLMALISFSKKIFTPVKQELRTMPMAA